MRIPWILTLVFLLAFAAVSGVMYRTLPTSIPVHFGVDGLADVWKTRTPARWYSPLEISVVFSALFFFLSRIIRRVGRKNPGVLAIPMRSLFLRIDASRRGFVFEAMDSFLAHQALLLSLLLFAFQCGVYIHATRAEPIHFIIIPAFTLYALLLTGGTIYFYARLKKRITEVYHDRHNS